MKYGRDIGVFILFLFTIFSASAQDDGKEDAVPYKELKQHIPAECRGLHKVKDIDDLLLQMHSNLDSQCLFKIPVEILEKIWYLPIIDSGDFYALPDSEKELIQKENNVFIQRDIHNSFCYIVVSDEVYISKRIQAKEPPYKRFPKNLPPPRQEEFNFAGHSVIRIRSLGDEKYYRQFVMYYWLGQEKLPNMPILIGRTFEKSVVHRFSFCKNANVEVPYLFNLKR